MSYYFACTLCHKRKFNQLQSYLLHLRIRHANDANFRVTCGILSCKSEYDRYASYYKHIYRHHKEFIASISIGENRPQLDDGDSNASSTESDNELHAEQASSSLPADIPQMQQNFYQNLSESMLKYSVRMREILKLPASTHRSIMEDNASLLTNIVSGQADLISSHLKNQGYNVSDDVELQSILDPSKIERILTQCSSSYKLTQDCVNKLGMIKPIAHQIGKYTGYYVPLTGVLRMLVQKQDIVPYVLNHSTSNDDHLTDYTCGDA